MLLIFSVFRSRNSGKAKLSSIPGRWDGLPRSPDLNPNSILLWGYVKDITCGLTTQVTTTDEIKQLIAAVLPMQLQWDKRRNQLSARNRPCHEGKQVGM